MCSSGEPAGRRKSCLVNHPSLSGGESAVAGSSRAQGCARRRGQRGRVVGFGDLLSLSILGAGWVTLSLLG